MEVTEEQITRLYGPRCTEHCDDCCVCEVWAMHDRIEELDRHLTLSGKVNKALSERIDTLDSECQRLRTVLQYIADLAYVDQQSGNQNFEYLQEIARTALQENEP